MRRFPRFFADSRGQLRWAPIRASPGATLLAALFAVMGCDNPAQPGPSPKTGSTTAVAPDQPVDLDAVRSEVELFCGGCHAVPPPHSFPKQHWYHEIERGYQFFLESGRTDLTPPRRADVVQYFLRLAPDKLLLDSPEQDQDVRFQAADLNWNDTRAMVKDTAISYLQVVADPGRPTAELAFCDMKSGNISWISFPKLGKSPPDGKVEARIAYSLKLQNPDHICQTDLDADGLPDYLVSDLGSATAEDHDRGRVVWLRPMGGSELEQVVLLNGIGRVADAQPADFDGDGDLDIIVAAFGWHTTGHLILLRQQGAESGRPRFESTVIDRRPGAIHVPVADLNGDRRPDFVVVFAQEHESVEAFISQTDGAFDKQIIYRAPDPSFGSTGIQLVDLDRDGDTDVLYTNGDTFDSFYVKPYHSIRWIENRGDSTWQDHLLTTLPGVHRALAGDLDGDGDLDIAACSFIPAQSIARQPEVASFTSLIWLEQQAGKFARHEIEANHCLHAALELADLNHDGALDIVVGNFGQSAADQLPPFAVWLNQAPRPSSVSDSRGAPVPAIRSEAAAN